VKPPRRFAEGTGVSVELAAAYSDGTMPLLLPAYEERR
jgi:hypothetical protein